jgi:hypothetical protein
MLHGLDLHVVPILEEVAEYAAVVTEVTVEVRRAFPNTDSGEMGGLELGDLPLIHTVIRDSVEPNLAITPWLNAGPLYAIVEILGLLWAPERHISRGGTSTPGVDTNTDIALWHPFFRINHLPVLILIARVGGHIRILLCHTVPGCLVSLLKGEALAVGAITHDDRILSRLDGPKDIGD